MVGRTAALLHKSMTNANQSVQLFHKHVAKHSIDLDLKSKQDDWTGGSLFIVKNVLIFNEITKSIKIYILPTDSTCLRAPVRQMTPCRFT